MLNEKFRAEFREEVAAEYKYRETGITDEEFEKRCQEKYRAVLGSVPPRYKHITGEDLPERLKESFQPSEGKSGFYFWGPVGTGKTAVLYAVKEKMARDGKRFRIANMTELLYEVKSSFNSNEKVDIVEEGRYYIGFDDLGTEKDSEWAGEQVYRLVNSIYENKRAFAFTSNFSLKELANRYGDHGDRIASRIAEMADVVEINGTDRRL